MYVLLRFAGSQIGRTIAAICQDETATELMGVNVRAYKLFAFVAGAGLAGLAGGLNAHFTFFISPNEYGFDRGVEILAMGVLGGTGSPWGAVVGGVLITLLPELLRGLGDYRPLINGMILIVIILYSPKGIWDLTGYSASARRGRLVMLRLSSIAKNFGGLQVLQDISLTVPERGIFGLIGPNGAGKTTVFNLITGLLAPTSGTIEFRGQPLNGLAPHRITRCGIARTFQNIRIFKEMSLRENVLVALGRQERYGAMRVLWPSARWRSAQQRECAEAEMLLAKVGLADKAAILAGKLSYGEQRRLEIARALATAPELLLLDEPAAGMNGAEKQQLMEEIVKLEASGLAILIIEHDMRFVMGLCRQIAVLNFGQLIAQGTAGEIRANPAVVEAYLGEESADAARRCKTCHERVTSG